MKKLMIVAAAALCAAVGFAEGIESSNVVGYDETGLREGSKGAGASFVNIGQTGAIDLQKILISGYDPEEGSAGDVTTMTLDGFGRTVDTYFWYDVPGEFYGWYTSDDEYAEGVSFLPGEGLYFVAASGDFTVKSSGEVPTANIAVQLRDGSKHVVNPTPVTIDINDEDNGVTVSGYDPEEGSGGEVMAMTLDSFGRTVETYFWYDVPGEFYGWFNTDDEFAEGVMMKPGESLYFIAPSDGYSVNFKGVEIK